MTFKTTKTHHLCKRDALQIKKIHHKQTDWGIWKSNTVSILFSQHQFNFKISLHQEFNDLKMKMRKLEDDLSLANKNLAEKEDEIMELEDEMRSFRSLCEAPRGLSERKYISLCKLFATNFNWFCQTCVIFLRDFFMKQIAFHMLIPSFLI